jgi:E3 ubiquitin-protein ligase RNF38/44
MNGVVKKLSSAEIQSLPTFEFKSTHAASDDKTCSICFEDYQLKETLIALACSHKFHKGCIVQWLKVSLLFSKIAYM